MSDEEAAYSLVMPFVVCQSKGGPYDDESYVAGWEAGVIDAMLKVTRGLGLAPNFDLSPPFHAGNREQIDLIAMKHGYVAAFEEVAPGWISLELTPTTSTDEGEV